MGEILGNFGKFGKNLKTRVDISENPEIFYNCEDIGIICKIFGKVQENFENYEKYSENF